MKVTQKTALELAKSIYFDKLCKVTIHDGFAKNRSTPYYISERHVDCWCISFSTGSNMLDVDPPFICISKKDGRAINI